MLKASGVTGAASARAVRLLKIREPEALNGLVMNTQDGMSLRRAAGSVIRENGGQISWRENCKHSSHPVSQASRGGANMLLTTSQLSSVEAREQRISCTFIGVNEKVARG